MCGAVLQGVVLYGSLHTIPLGVLVEKVREKNKTDTLYVDPKRGRICNGIAGDEYGQWIQNSSHLGEGVLTSSLLTIGAFLLVFNIA